MGGSFIHEKSTAGCAAWLEMRRVTNHWAGRHVDEIIYTYSSRPLNLLNSRFWGFEQDWSLSINTLPGANYFCSSSCFFTNEKNWICILKQSLSPEEWTELYMQVCFSNIRSRKCYSSYSISRVNDIVFDCQFNFSRISMLLYACV